MRSAEQSLHLVAATVGFSSFFLIWVTVLWGLFLRNGWALTWVRHSTLLATHTTLALFGLCLGVVHAGVQLVKPGNLFRVVDLVVPFTYWRDPVGVGVAVIGLEVLVAVAASVVIQRFLGYGRWRALHALSYVAFTLVVAHILISGTDLGRPVLAAAVVGAWLLTAAAWLATTPVAAAVRRRARRRRGAEQPGLAPPRGQEMTVNVNAARCARFGFCEQEAPEVFRLRGDGRLAYRASVPPAQATPVIRAAEVCPARAITLTRVPVTMLAPRPPAGPGLGAGAGGLAGGGPRRRRVQRYRGAGEG